MERTGHGEAYEPVRWNSGDEVGRGAGVDRYRRANILDVAVCTYPFILPFFIPTVLASSMTAGVDGMPRLTPWDAGGSTERWRFSRVVENDELGAAVAALLYFGALLFKAL